MSREARGASKGGRGDPLCEARGSKQGVESARAASFITQTKDGILIRVFVHPRASKDKIAGVHGDELKVAVTAPPVDNSANEAVCRFLAGLLRVPKSAVSVKSGHASRHKTIVVAGATASAAGVLI